MGRFLLDTVSESILNVFYFGIKFVAWCFQWSLAAVVLLAIMAASGYTVYAFALRGSKYVTVPEVTGKPIMDASLRLAEEGLEMEIRPEDQVPHPEVPAGHVISQRPAAGRVIRQGRRVNLIVSAGKDYFKAPDFTQKRLDEAQREILATSFRLGSVARIPSDLPRDTVLAQDPAPGRAIDRQGTISLLLSAGNEKRAAYMPDLRGMSVQQALQLMAGYGVVMTARPVDAPSAAADVVLDQDPPPDTLIYPDTAVTYHVKAGAAAEARSEFQNTIQHVMQQDWYSSALRVDLIDSRGDRQVLLSAPPASETNSGLSGVAPGETARRTRSAGGKITIPVRYTNEAMVEIYLDNRLMKSYYLKHGAISN